MDSPPTLGPPVRTAPVLRSCLAVFAATGVSVGGWAATARAADRYALVVSGASGGPEYAAKYSQWRASFTAILRARFGYPDDHVVVLADADDPRVRKPTRDNVRAALVDLRQRASKDDVILVLLIGHGTASDASAGEAKFNLVGPDLSAVEWAELVKPIAGRVVFVDTTSGSSPFLQAISAPGRIVVTATDATAQQYETVFPEFFLKAFASPEADVDKNGRVSIWEAFSYASNLVRQWYQQRGQLQTERALLDDNGDGVGREAQSPGPDGALAQVTYLDREQPVVVPGDSVLTALIARRADIEAQVERLKARKPELPPDQYDAQMEALLLDLARLDAQIRNRP
jgi:hypothetical protein